MLATYILAEYDQEIINLAQQMFGQLQPKSDLPPAEPEALPEAPEIKVEARPDRTEAPKAKETKTAAELARMIEADLAKHSECAPGRDLW